MHHILKRQIKRYLGTHATPPPEWRELFESVSRTYADFDEDRVFLDHSLELSSKEFLESNRRLEKTRLQVEKQAEGLAREVAKRTKDLDKRVVELEQAKIAARNVLEDLQVEKEKLDYAKIKEEALANDLKKFKLAVDNASELIVIADPEGILIYGNKAMETITGYTVAEAIGKKTGALWKTPKPIEYYKKFWETIKIQKQTFKSEIQNRRKNGQLYTSMISVSPILDKNGGILYFIGIERDVTKEKEIDKVKTEFVSLASHQLRTPLSAVNWYTEMLLAGDAGTVTPDQRKYLKEIYKSNQRMVDLVNALLNVSHLELGTFAIEPELTDLTQLTQSVIDEQKPQIDEKKIKISSSFEKAIPRILVDQKLRRIVIQNILSNAVKYTPEGGTVELFLSIDKKTKNLLLKVSDTGYGIPKHQQDKIFSKFFRADNIRGKDTEGTGLGLYIVKSIIEHSGGDVWFESEENKGSTFFVTLPPEGMKKKEGTKTLA